VSGEPSAGSTSPYRASDLYTVSGTPNYTVVAQEGLARCNSSQVFENSLVGPSGPPAERVVSSFTEACPGTLVEDSQGGRLMTPQEALKYNCSDKCVQWLINYGVCGATDLKAVRLSF
jgi:hypothetical protein